MATDGTTDSMDKIICSTATESSLESSIMEQAEPDPNHEDECLSKEHRLMLGHMPEEILEHILGFLSHYREMDMAKLVSKQWNRVIKSTVKQKKRKFLQSLSRCDVQWTEIHKDRYQSLSEKGHIGITDRFSHSAAYYNGFMYVFGGCTSTSTTFNDLWSFDLTHRKWVRPVAMGTYPSPKACATMVVYKGNLVLYGGWSHPIPYPLHQSAHYFSELHMYSPSTNRWAYIHSLGQEPEALGGHSASVVGHLMVVFGGSPRPGMGTNNLWVFNFQKNSWTLQPVACDAVPEPRYGQFQITLDDRHILIMGGCVGQNRVYTDVWLLTLEPASPWRWTKLAVECPELGAPQTWCHAACRVNNLIVVVAKSNTQRQTRLVKRVRRKRQDRSRYPAASSSAPSPSLTTIPAGANATEKLYTFGPISTSKMQGVYIHPKLQPQPKRGAALSERKETKNISPNVGGSTEVATVAGGGGAMSGPLMEALTTRHHETQSSDRPDYFSSQPQGTTVSSPGSRSGLDPASSRSKAEGLQAAPNLSQQALVEPSSPVVSSAHPQNNSLLALQQRLHRECLNLPDPDDHHHNSRHRRRHSGGAGIGVWKGDDDDDDDDRAMPDGYFHRLHNRWLGGQTSVDVASDNRVTIHPSSSQASPSPLSTEKSQVCECLVNDGASSSGIGHSENTDDLADPKPKVGENINSSSVPHASVHPQPQLHQHQYHQQPMSSQFYTSRQGQRSHVMPSIRPNATSNRQRQLEALQRQEELLRSKSRALAAARGTQPQVQPVPLGLQEEPSAQQHRHENNIPTAEGIGAVREKKPLNAKDDNGGIKNNLDNYKDDEDFDDDDDDGDGGPSAPTQMPSKNKMDVHVLDISRALSEHIVRWGPLSELQPPEAPEETICCSLVEGRGELVLFGGVRRDMTGADIGPAGVTNIAVSRLYLLGPE